MNDPGDVTVGVLSLHNSKETKAILNAADALGADTAWLREETTAVEIEDGQARLDPPVDVVANRLLLSNDEQPMEGLGLAATIANLRPTLNPPTAVLQALHKFASATALSDAGLPVPDAVLALADDRLNEARGRFGDRAVYKTAIGTHGGGTWLLDLDDPVNTRVGHRQGFIQEYVDLDDERNRDRRIYVVGDEVVGAMTRYAPEGEWRTNVALGGSVEDASMDLDPELVDVAVEATDVIGLDYAGVDVVEGPGGYGILEVNPTAGFRGLFEASGVSPAPYIAGLAIERAGGSVARDDVERLAEQLDDSRPAATPEKRSRPAPEQTSIGYIEEATVIGTRGTETVMAKSDTGATRTSVDTELATRIGTGPIKDSVTVKSGSVKEGRSRPLVDIVVGLGGTRHTVTASLEDRGHMEYPLLLGRDILQHYSVDVTKRADEQSETETEEEEDSDDESSTAGRRGRAVEE